MAGDVPHDLQAHRDELQRQLEADVEAAAIYTETVLKLNRSAEIARAELVGIDRAITAYRAATVERLVPRRLEAAE